MKLDTDILRVRIEAERNRVQRQKEQLEKEIAQLMAEDESLAENLQALGEIERVAGQLEVLERLDGSGSFAPPQQEPSQDLDPIEPFDEWGVGSRE